MPICPKRLQQPTNADGIKNGYNFDASLHHILNDHQNHAFVLEELDHLWIPVENHGG